MSAAEGAGGADAPPAAKRRRPTAAGRTLRVAAVQFEMAEDDKAANLATMRRLAAAAAADGAQVVSFPEMCTTGYHYITTSAPDRLRSIAEAVDGETVRSVKAVASDTGAAVCFGMLESDAGLMYNTYVVVHPTDGVVFRHRKVHAFESSAIVQGSSLDTFELFGWRCGVLVCYDGNLPENARVLSLRGAEVIFMPHQTGGFDISRAGMGRIPLDLWRRRREDPIPCRDAFAGKKGREWLMKWLPSRAYDNNVFVVYANGVGVDGPEVRPGGSLVLDPDGLVLDEVTALGEGAAVATLRHDLLADSLAASHVAARRPSLYAQIVAPVAEVDTRTARNRVSGEQIE